jgi:hypothetical protein
MVIREHEINELDKICINKDRLKEYEIKDVTIPLITSNEKDISKIENILFIHDEIQDYSKFVSSSNETTYTIVYNNHSTKEELKTIFQEKLRSCTIKRLGLVFHNASLVSKSFLDNELLFTKDDLIQTDSTLYSNNVKCIIELLNTYHIENIDYLACNTLQYEHWNQYYDLIEKTTSAIVSASNDETGNLKYGGNWVLENTNTNIESIYFNEKIQNYQYKLATTTISTSTTIKQNDIDSYTFPVTINGGTSSSQVVITFGENLTINSTQRTSGYFIIGSEYITINGDSKTVTIEDVPKYPGLIQNGTSSINAYSNITIENIGILSNIITTLSENGGWLCQSYFGRKLSTGTLTIVNCYSTGIMSGIYGGSICGQYYGYQASGGTLTIQNCYSTGEINIDGGGGICGGNYGNQASGGIFIIENCYSTGTISGPYCGGIVGGAYAFQSSGVTFTIQNCYSTGAISGPYCGGIGGDLYGNTTQGKIIISNCYSIGNISNNSGGIIGPFCGNTSTTLNVINCYTIGIFNYNNGIFGPYKVVGTAINCRTSNSNIWSDSLATSTIYVGQPNTWLNTNIGLPWLLQSNNAVLMNITTILNYPINTILSVTFNSNQPTSNFGSENITFTNGILSNFTSINSAKYSATFTPELGKNYTLQVEANKYTNGNDEYNKASNIIYGFLSSTISTSTIITQALIDSYTFPVRINGGTIGNPVVITFNENLIIGPSVGSNGYFILESDYITIHGNDKTVTINDVLNYPGLIQNGTKTIVAQTNISIQNIGILSNGFTTLRDESGWLCQQYYGYLIDSGTLTIANCYSTGTISGTYCGGICGPHYGKSVIGGKFIIENCYSTGTISGNYSGGICGYYYGYRGNGDTFTLKNCYSTGIISGDNSGGICGGDYGVQALDGSYTIENCYSTGEISGSYSGGIMGYNYGVLAYGGNFTIENSYNTGTISGVNCGGIFGSNYGVLSSGGTFTIQNCYSTGIINGTYNGGISGSYYGVLASGGKFNIENCYSTGTISGNFNGGICASYYAVRATGGIFTIKNCYSLGEIMNNNSGGIVGALCGRFSSNITINVNNCYTTGKFTNNNGIFGPNKAFGKETNCLASNNNTWSDSQATSTINIEKPTTWLIFNNNTPWLLLSFNAEIYDPNTVISGKNPYITHAGLFINSIVPLIDYTYSIITVNNSYIMPLQIKINKSNGKIIFENITGSEYKVQVLVGDNTTVSGIYQHYQINYFTLIYEPYDIYNITFSKLLILEDSMNFTYKGYTDNINNRKYVSGKCSFILVNQSDSYGGKQTWQWQTEIIQNNKKAYLTGTIITNNGILLTPEYLWNLILYNQQKTLCTFTLDKYNPVAQRNDLVSYLYVVGRTDETNVSKLYLFTTINSYP